MLLKLFGECTQRAGLEQRVTRLNRLFEVVLHRRGSEQQGVLLFLASLARRMNLLRVAVAQMMGLVHQ